MNVWPQKILARSGHLVHGEESLPRSLGCGEQLTCAGNIKNPSLKS